MTEKTYFLSRHGCAKNQVDAELIVGTLGAKGWKQIDIPEKAAVIIVNSCGFIESAKTESLDAVFSAKKSNPQAKIVLAGCLAQRYAKELSENLPEADAFFGNGDISKITEVFDALFSKSPVTPKRKKNIWLYPQKGVSCGARPKSFSFPASTYIKITEGCNNCCSFCAIPLIRGAVRSRKISSIVSEIKTFIDQGFYEFNLIGQDLAAFTTKDKTNISGSSLSKLLSEISRIKGDFVIRLLYIHPDHFPLDILTIMKADSRFLPYFDLPFQSGSEKILKDMNRTGNSTKYLSLIQNIKDTFKSTKYKTACIRTTFLVGFPGESEIDFNETLNFQQNAKPLWSGAFEFSPEENTKAINLPNPVPKKIAVERKNILQESQTQITRKLLQNFIGFELIVLVEEIVEVPYEKSYFALGRSWFQAPEVDGCIVTSFDEKDKLDIRPGCKIKVLVLEVVNLDLKAKLLQIL